MSILILTAIEKTWGRGKNLYFLGDWCCLYNRKEKWNNKKNKVQEYHWKDRDKFIKDSEYLEKFIDDLQPILSEFLSKKHNVVFSKRAWRVILGPWLVLMIPILWDRWESIRIALSSQQYDSINLIDTNSNDMIPDDYVNFTEMLNDHLWNNNFFKDILLFLDVENIKKYPYKNKNKNKNKNIFSIRLLILNWINFLIKLFPLKEGIFFHTSGMSFGRYTLLSFRLGQAPLFHFLDFDKAYKNIKYDSIKVDCLRRHSLIPINGKLFEDFVYSKLLSYIPFSYLENFQAIKEETQKINFLGDIIFSSTSYFSSDFFKIWVANQVDNEKKLLISEHGSSIIPKCKIFKHDDKISDYRVTWSIPINDKHIQLPPNKSITKLFKFQNYFRNTEKYLTLIGLEFPLYAHSCYSGPISSIILDDYSQKVKFIDKLNKDVRGKLNIRPYTGYNNKGWQTKERYKDKYGISKISTNKKLQDDINTSKIIICTYPETTFSEAVSSGVPTILLYLESSYEFETEFYDLISELKDKNIIFSDPLKAANHINNIWDNPMGWWDSPEVISARNRFFDMCCKSSDNWLNEWSFFLKSTVRPNFRTAP